VDGVTGLKSFGDMWKNLSKSIVNGLKEIAVQLLKMAALRGIASIFGLGEVFTGFDLAKGLIQKSNIFGGGGGSTPSAPGASKLNANLFTGFDLAKGLIEKGGIFKASVPSAGRSNKISIQNKVSLDGRQLITAQRFAANNNTMLGFS